MFSIIAAFSLIACLVNADTVVPVQSSQVDVRQSGGEFSYNIQENRGVAAISDSAVPIVAPLVKSIPTDTKSEGSEHMKDGHDEPRARVEDTKELKKPTIIAQPLIAPLEYIPIYAHPGYTVPALPKASMLAPIPTIPAIPYPYTLIRTV